MFRYPHEPRGLDEQASLDWWDAYWASPAGRDCHEYGRRNRIVPVAPDGRFHFPMLPPGKYKLRASSGDQVLSLSESEWVTAYDQRGTVVDLGSLMVETVKSSFEPKHGEVHDHDHTEKPASWIPARPLKTTVSTGSAIIFTDLSVGLQGDVTWQEATTHFAFNNSTTLDELLLELLSVDSPAGPQFGRVGEKLILFDVKAELEKQTADQGCGVCKRIRTWRRLSDAGRQE